MTSSNGYDEVKGYEPRINENELANGLDYHKEEVKGTVPWTNKYLHDVRLRLLSEAFHPVWDISYCLGYLGEGFENKVRVTLPFSSVPKGTSQNRVSPRMFIIQEARKAGVYAKGIGILDGLSRVQA